MLSGLLFLDGILMMKVRREVNGMTYFGEVTPAASNETASASYSYSAESESNSNSNSN